MTDDDKNEFTMIFGYGLIPNLTCVDIDQLQTGQAVTLTIAFRSDAGADYKALENHPAELLHVGYKRSRLQPEQAGLDVWLEEHILTRYTTPDEQAAIEAFHEKHKDDSQLTRH